MVPISLDDVISHQPWVYFSFKSNSEVHFLNPKTGLTVEGSIEKSVDGYYLLLNRVRNCLPFDILADGDPHFKRHYIEKHLYYMPGPGTFPELRNVNDILEILSELDKDLQKKYPNKGNASPHSTSSESVPQKEDIPNLFPSKKHYSLKFEL